MIYYLDDRKIILVTNNSDKFKFFKRGLYSVKAYLFTFDNQNTNPYMVGISIAPDNQHPTSPSDLLYNCGLTLYYPNSLNSVSMFSPLVNRTYSISQITNSNSLFRVWILFELYKEEE